MGKEVDREKNGVADIAPEHREGIKWLYHQRGES